jgi:hypothetical protein
MEITIDSNLVDTLITLADGQSMTVDAYASNIIEQHLLSALRTKLNNDVAALDLGNIAQVKNTVAMLSEEQTLLKQGQAIK